MEATHARSAPPCRIAYIQYTNPGAYPPLQHSSRWLADSGWQVLVLGIQVLGTEALHFPTHANITVRQLSPCPAGWRQKLHYVLFTMWSLAWVVRWRPHWIYASDPLSSPVAWLLSYLPGLRVVYHEHDSPAVGKSAAQPSLFFRLMLWTRRRLARRVAAYVLPNEQRLQRFQQETKTGASGFCVWNCPSQDECVPPRDPLSEHRLRVFYHGTLGPTLLPDTILDALVCLPACVTLTVIGYEVAGHEGYTRTLQQRATHLGISPRLEITGPLPRKTLLERCREFDVGLVCVPPHTSNSNLFALAGASNKAFDYLACGLPLLVSDAPDWCELYVTPGYARVCDPGSPQTIANALRWFLTHPRELRLMGERGRQRIEQEWHYERQFAPVYDLLVQYTGVRRRGSRGCS